MIKVTVRGLGIFAQFPNRNLAERFIDWVLESTMADSIEVVIENEEGEKEWRICMN